MRKSLILIGCNEGHVCTVLFEKKYISKSHYGELVRTTCVLFSLEKKYISKSHYRELAHNNTTHIQAHITNQIHYVMHIFLYVQNKTYFGHVKCLHACVSFYEMLVTQSKCDRK